jgi:hypothetical protein
MAIYKLNRFLFSFLILCFLCQSTLVLADTITGKVFNQTTGQPAAGDDVVLLKAGDLAQDQAHTKTDAQGAFTFNNTDPKSAFVVRVLHQGVNYDHNVIGVNPVEITVFDAVPTMPGLSGTIGMVRIEPDKGGLMITEAYAIANASTPPVTQAGGPNVEISLPAKAVLDWVQVLDNGNWIIRSALPVKGQDGHYAASVPFRPGNTFYKFSYHLPYQGSAAFHLRTSFPIQKFAISLSPSLALKPAQAGTFKSPGMVEGLQVYQTMEPVSKNVPAFTVSNSGETVPPPAPSRPEAAAPPPAAARRPQAAPAAAPEQPTPQQSRQEFWPILILIFVLVAVGLFGLWRMRRNTARAAMLASGLKSQPSALDALKEELFRLESERLEGSISAEEYESAKAALTQHIHRAMEQK